MQRHTGASFLALCLQQHLVIFLNVKYDIVFGIYSLSTRKYFRNS